MRFKKKKFSISLLHYKPNVKYNSKSNKIYKKSNENVEMQHKNANSAVFSVF